MIERTGSNGCRATADTISKSDQYPRSKSSISEQIALIREKFGDRFFLSIIILTKFNLANLRSKIGAVLSLALLSWQSKQLDVS